jgi:tetratricopeptide (TPR) repeat protein
VADGARAADFQDADAEALLLLAMSRPREAMATARALLAGRPGPYAASVAHQAAGIVLRETGDVQAGVRELQRALRQARRTGSGAREADVLSSLGVALVYAGRTAAGLTAFDQATELAAGSLAGRVLLRRGLALWTLGRFDAALADLGRAISELERAGDRVWTARALSGRGLTLLAVGSTASADADFRAAGQLYAETDQAMESANTVLNRGFVAFRSGDLPAALACLDDAARRYRTLRISLPSLRLDRCYVLLAAGLVHDALAEADTALSEIEEARGPSPRKAELLLMAAQCALAAGQPQAALGRAQAAMRLFRAHGNAWYQAHARLVLGQAQYRVSGASSRLLRAAAATATQLAALGSGEATAAHLLAGRIALDLGRPEEAGQHLLIAARSRLRGPAMVRAIGWLSEALRAEAAGQRRRMLTACRRGLQVLDEHRWTLGSSELRAQASGHGAELAALALRQAASAHRPRQLLAWTERCRGTALLVPAPRLAADLELVAGLAALREVTSRLEDARRQGSATAALAREQLQREEAVRARSLLARGSASPGAAAADAGELLTSLPSGQLVEIIEVDGVLHALVCRAGRVRQFVAGPARDAVRAADFARFALRRLASNRPGSDPQAALAILRRAGPDLQAALLGPAAAAVRDGPVVVVPPARLHGIPWALLPVLRERVFSVAPSAGAWLRAAAAAGPPDRRVALACGPGLATGGAEVPAVARLHDNVTVLDGARATAGNVLAAMDGAWLGHIAAHGTFRAESPLFSSLRMCDGPLTAYDFEQLGRAPYRLVLSSCDAGALAPTGADELLGLASSLLPLGTAGIVAAAVPLNDRAVVPLMVELHEGLRAGKSLAESALSLRLRGGRLDPAEQAAAISLVTFGAG